MLAILLAAQMISSTPPLAPAEAARILARSPGESNWTHDLPPLPEGPTVTIAWTSPTGGPFGEFDLYSPGRRLDGTYLTDPPAFYSPAFYPLYGFQGSYFPRYGRPRLAHSYAPSLPSGGGAYTRPMTYGSRNQGGSASRSINHGAASVGRPSGRR